MTKRRSHFGFEKWNERPGFANCCKDFCLRFFSDGFPQFFLTSEIFGLFPRIFSGFFDGFANFR